MKSEHTIVTDKNGIDQPAELLVCEHCDGQVFCLFVVDGHSHIQCATEGCGATYCQGTCDNEITH